ncbi:MAG: hypothetical protein ABEJ84_00890 [Halodesulfurarchaeum sp.]
MPERRTLDDRLSALERRLDDPAATEASAPGGNSTAVEETAEPDAALRSRVEGLEAELDELQAGLQALRGYVGNVEYVNESVERRANAAIAAVERLESAPKTPPPIATATPPNQPTVGTATKQEGAAVSAEETDPDAADDGILDRLRALR